MTCAARRHPVVDGVRSLRPLRTADHYPPDLPDLRAAALAAARSFADGVPLDRTALAAAGDALAAAVEGDPFDLLLATACQRAARVADSNLRFAREAMAELLGDGR